MTRARVWMLVLPLFPMMAAAAVAPGSAAAQQQIPHTAERTIRVTGMGEVQAEPDRAHLDLAVETAAPTAEAAGEQNAQLMDRVIAALVAAGVPRTNIETRNYSIYPEYAPPSPRDTIGGEPRIEGYRARNMVSVETPELERIGALIDIALEAGANRVDAVRFSLNDADAAQAEATRRAVERARQSAETIAAALGVQLGPVLDASTTADPVRPFPVMMRAQAESAMDAAATPIQPEEQTVMAQVSLVYRIDG